ncbi:hypothetical protein B1759_15075 [Rubrivirga sp. SAORIC476]|uniref:hypothetical protein n=1 Tax=Rubrivirga sp. SAORIC476 TaxID=1961794 RepID=UPI000BA95743|nr:hypothetical protein [Rubrivirga sp. SAORIC476]PAP79639.1 hypothetical protein B1759_15075 [Rubrivirga sp. SAORIC476]
MLDIPDHDGRPTGDLEDAFRRIDADRRLYLVDGDRRVFRAAAAWDAGSAMGVHRELALSVADIAARLHMDDWEVRRLLMGPEDYVLGEAQRILYPPRRRGGRSGGGSGRP